MKWALRSVQEMTDFETNVKVHYSILFALVTLSYTEIQGLVGRSSVT